GSAQVLPYPGSAVAVGPLVINPAINHRRQRKTYLCLGHSDAGQEGCDDREEGDDRPAEEACMRRRGKTCVSLCATISCACHDNLTLENLPRVMTANS